MPRPALFPRLLLFIVVERDRGTHGPDCVPFFSPFFFRRRLELLEWLASFPFSLLKTYVEPHLDARGRGMAPPSLSFLFLPTSQMPMERRRVLVIPPFPFFSFGVLVRSCSRMTPPFFFFFSLFFSPLAEGHRDSGLPPPLSPFAPSVDPELPLPARRSALFFFFFSCTAW